MSERFILAESSGYPIRPGNPKGGHTRWTTEYMVLDTAYCHRVVWSSFRNPRVSVGSEPNRRELKGRAKAEEICRRFNENGTRFPTFNHFKPRGN